MGCVMRYEQRLRADPAVAWNARRRRRGRNGARRRHPQRQPRPHNQEGRAAPQNQYEEPLAGMLYKPSGTRSVRQRINASQRLPHTSGIPREENGRNAQQAGEAAREARVAQAEAAAAVNRRPMVEEEKEG